MAPDWFHPVIDEESRPFWDGCREGKLLLKRCRACDARYFYPRALCPTCWSADTIWIAARGTGRLYSHSVIYQFPIEPFASMVPYANILVDLDEGPRMMATWDPDVSLERLCCDLAVEVGFRQITETLSLPTFRPVESKRDV